MRPLFALAVAVLPLPVAVAQMTGDLATLTPVAVMTTGVPGSFVGLPSGAPIVGQLDNSTSGFPMQGSRVRAAVNVTSGSVAFGFNTSAMFLTTGSAGQSTGTSSSPAAVGAIHGPLEFLARVQAAPGTAGQLVFQCNRTNTGVQANVVNQFAIDVHADGTPEVTTVGVGNLPVTVGATGELRIRIQLENHAVFSATSLIVSSNTVNVTFVPDPVASCSITPYGTSCGGATSSGSELVLGTTRAVTLLGSGGFAHSPMLSVFGTQSVGPVLPGGCLLRNDASIVVMQVSDASGFAVHSFTLPVSAQGTLYHQFVPVDLGTFTIRSSNGLDITCVR